MSAPAGPRPERPELATIDARGLRQVSRVLAVLIVVLLVVFLFRAGRSVLAEGERMALDLAVEHLEDLVWLEGKRVLAEEGVAGLRRRAGSDPRAWARERLGRERPEDRPVGALPEWADERWSFDAGRGELVYRPAWDDSGERRWRIEVQADGSDSATPGLARDLHLVEIGGSSSP